jgi:hypothetical protein
MIEPFCVKCQRFMFLKKVGVTLELTGKGMLPQLWMSDLWQCKICGVEVLKGFGCCPLMKGNPLYESTRAQAIKEGSLISAAC